MAIKEVKENKGIDEFFEAIIKNDLNKINLNKSIKQ